MAKAQIKQSARRRTTGTSAQASGPTTPETIDYSQVWDFDPDWTLDEAQAATEKACAAGAPWSHPHLPIFRWFAHHRLEEQREAFEAGDKFALMHALRICANHALSMPDWAARAYIRAYDTIISARAKSWDEVLGAPYLLLRPDCDHGHIAWGVLRARDDELSVRARHSHL